MEQEMSVRYSEFEWRTAGSANGDSGAALARAFIGIIEGLGGIKRICDLGCGNGYLAAKLAALGYEVTGVDASTSGIETARRNCGQARFVLSEVDGQLDQVIETGTFDLVVSGDVIEHLYRPTDLLETASRLLRHDGQILISAPYHGYLKNLALSLSGKMDAHFCALQDGGHIKFFSVKTLSKLIEQQGFTDIRISFFGRAPWLWKNMICHARKSD